jgi:predicted RNA-binding Zn ribbon-like protein
MNVTGHPCPTVVVPAPADDLCLDFVNTRYWRGSAEPTETLTGPDNLSNWIKESCGWPDFVGTNRLADRAFPAAIELRELLFGLLSTTANGRPLPPADLDRLNAALAEAPTRQMIADRGWVLKRVPESVFALLAPVLWSVGDLLLGPRTARVRQCANPACEFLFLDDSKSGNRRWCSMSSCGNRAKAHRHYLRHKGERGDAQQ